MVAAVALATHPPASAQDGDATLVFAAASLKEALDGAVEDYRTATGRDVAVSYARVPPWPSRSRAARRLMFSSPPIWNGWITWPIES
jgi:hypothetical protein